MTNIHKLFYFILLVNLSANAQLNLGIGVGHQYGLGFGSRLGYKLGPLEPNFGVGLAFASSSFDNQKRNTPVLIYTLGFSYYQKEPLMPFSTRTVNDNVSYCYARFVGTDKITDDNLLHLEIHSISKNAESERVYLGGKLKYGLGLGMSIARKTNQKNIIRGFPVISIGYIYRFGK